MQDRITNTTDISESSVQELNALLPDGFGIILTYNPHSIDDFTRRNAHIVQQLPREKAGQATYESEKFGPCLDLTKPLELAYQPAWMKELSRKSRPFEVEGTGPDRFHRGGEMELLERFH